MEMSDKREAKKPQQIVRGIVELCADCDSCRPLMDEICLFFPELYRLWDKEKEDGIPISAAELRSLTDLCTYCGVCPCPKIPADLMVAKSRYIDQEGLPLSIQILSDIPRLARVCNIFPQLVSAAQSSEVVSPLIRKLVHIHPDRELLEFPEQSFFAWAKERGLTSRREGRRNVAYFVGCSAGYLFPEVGRATVEVLERNNLTVYVPPQDCCGLPQLVEGDRKGALGCLQANMEQLREALQAGEELVCSCPSCGYLMKVLLKERAYYSEAYQKSVNAGTDELKIPDSAQPAGRHTVLKKSIYKDILKDDGYFASFDPLARIEVAEQLADAGEYLRRLHAEGLLDTRFHAIPQHMVYFAPCHQRQQKIDSPYLDLLGLIPELKVDRLVGMDCCGMGGNFGFKADFHDKSLAIGQPLLAKIREKSPQAIITDCMSCKLQFNHALPYPVFHPLEILARAYQAENIKPDLDIKSAMRI